MTYCEECPRAILCIARDEDILPLMVCVICTQIFDFEVLVQRAKSGYAHTEYRLSHVQGPVPYRKNLCPKPWLIDADPSISFKCKRCSAKGSFAYSGKGFWTP